MYRRPLTAVNHIVEFISVTERRRLIVVVGIPVLFVALFELTANYGVLILLLAVGLAAFLYTRPTAQKTIAASAYGTGMAMVGLFILELYWNGTRGSTEPLIGTATRVLWVSVTGTVMIGLGLWLRQIEF